MGKQNAVANPIGIQGYKFPNQGSWNYFVFWTADWTTFTGGNQHNRTAPNDPEWKHVAKPLMFKLSGFCFKLTAAIAAITPHPTTPSVDICCVASTMCVSSTMLLHPTPPNATNVCFSPRPSTRRGPTTDYRKQVVSVGGLEF